MILCVENDKKTMSEIQSHNAKMWENVNLSGKILIPKINSEITSKNTHLMCVNNFQKYQIIIFSYHYLLSG